MGGLAAGPPNPRRSSRPGKAGALLEITDCAGKAGARTALSVYDPVFMIAMRLGPRPLLCGCCHVRVAAPEAAANTGARGLSREQVEAMGREVPGALLMG